MADRYHWLYDDFSARVGTRTPGVQAALRDLPEGARVLDAACGVGFDARSLHRRGFRVTATDASAAMVEQCRARLTAAGVDVPVATCAWAELPGRFEADFDAVLCTGNSLAHAPSTTARRAALCGFFEVLVAGGTVIVDAQDWRIVHERGNHRDNDPQVIARDGLQATRNFYWRVSGPFGDPITLELTLVVRDGDRERTTRHRVTFSPFTADELVAELEACGFVDVDILQNPGDDRQAFIARRSP